VSNSKSDIVFDWASFAQAQVPPWAYDSSGRMAPPTADLPPGFLSCVLVVRVVRWLTGARSARVLRRSCIGSRFGSAGGCAGEPARRS
jgi:hypothetical protein